MDKYSFHLRIEETIGKSYKKALRWKKNCPKVDKDKIEDWGCIRGSNNGNEVGDAKQGNYN